MYIPWKMPYIRNIPKEATQMNVLNIIRNKKAAEARRYAALRTQWIKATEVCG